MARHKKSANPVSAKIGPDELWRKNMMLGPAGAKRCSICGSHEHWKPACPLKGKKNG